MSVNVLDPGALRVHIKGRHVLSSVDNSDSSLLYCTRLDFLHLSPLSMWP